MSQQLDFNLSKSEIKKYEEWYNKLDKEEIKYEPLEFIFTPTEKGMFIEVQCGLYNLILRS